MTALYTYDVFDTLLTRLWVKPGDVFLHAGHRLRGAGLIAGEPAEWAGHRVAAEGAVRRLAGAAEVRLDDIYRELRRRVGWTEEAARRALDVELDCERVASRAIAPLVARVGSHFAAGAAVAYVSDFYVGSGFVAELLEQGGLRTEASRVFVSCDEGFTKRSGALFQAVAASCHVSPADILHTGDHVESDVKRARQAGLGTQPVRGGGANESELALARARPDGTDAVSSHLTASAVAGAARRARLSRELSGREAEIWRVATGVAGPLLFGYVRWVLTQAHERGVDRLYFLARDGQILKRVAERILPSLGFAMELRYLYASRRAWFAAVDADAVASPAQAYFRQEGLYDGRPVAMVDIGWRGRLQQALSRLLRAGGNGRAPLGFYLGLRETPPAEAGLTGSYLTGPASLSVNPSLAELFCAADHGTLLGYDRTADGVIAPVLATQRDTLTLDWGLELLQEGIIDFTSKMNDALEVLRAESLFCPRTLQEAGVRAIARLVSRPSRAEANLLGEFPHSDSQYHTDMTELAPTVSPTTLLRAFLKPTSLAKRTYWHQATVARSTPAARTLLSLWQTRVEALPRLRKQLGW